MLTFLGLELDTNDMEIRLPMEKLQKIRVKNFYCTNKGKKITLQELQSLIGLLNFACAVVQQGRTFLRRLIDLSKGLRKPHHRCRLNREAKADLEAFKTSFKTSMERL